MFEKRWGLLQELVAVSGRVATMGRELRARKRLLAAALAVAPIPAPRREPDSEAAAA